MRLVRWTMAAAVLGAVLGCSGLGETMKALSGADIQVGDNARPPSDFPLAIPSDGKVTAVMSLPAGGMKTTTVTVEVPGDGAGLLEQYEQSMSSAGMTVTKTDSGAGDTITGKTEEGSFWSASLSREGGAAQLVLVVATMPGGAVPAAAPEGAAEAPAGEEPPAAAVPAAN